MAKRFNPSLERILDIYIRTSMRVSKIDSMYALSDVQIAQLLYGEVSKSTVYRRRKEIVNNKPVTKAKTVKLNGYATVKKRGNRKPNITIEVKQKIAHLYENGLSYVDIANELGVSKSTVARYCHFIE